MYLFLFESDQNVIREGLVTCIYIFVLRGPKDT